MGNVTTPTILFLVNDADFFLSHRLNLAIAARRAGYRAVVGCPPGSATRILAEHGIEYVPTVAVRNSHGVLAQLGAISCYYRVIRQVRPDLVHLITSKPVIFGGALARIMGIPVVSAISGLGHVFTASGARIMVLRTLVCAGYGFALNRKKSIVIFQNEVDRSIFDRLRLIRRARTTIVKGSGVDLSRITVHPEPAGPIIVLLPARLLKDKGVEEFAAAARIVRERRPHVVFRLQGKIDPQNPTGLSLEELADWTAQGLLEHAPHSSDPDRMFAEVHIVALPSYREGFSKSLVDAAAAGRPVVTTDVPGCRDAIEPDRSGLLVPARDASALADAILRLVDDPALRSTMGAQGRWMAEAEFAIERISQQHLDIYAQALQLATSR